jgi:phage tail-like protein
MAERDPLVGFQYRIDVSGTITGYFTECSGLGSEHELIEHKIINEQGNEEIRMLPGRLKWDQIKLKRGITDNMDIWDWRKLVEEGKMSEARMNGSITMLNQELNPVAQWDFENGWPMKVTGPELKADSNAYGVEELTVVHEGIRRVS